MGLRWRGAGTTGFYLLWIGETLSQVGDWIHYLALIFYVTSVTRSMSGAGMALLFSAIPSTILGPFAGVVADRWDRKALIVASNVLSGVFALTLGFLTFHGAPPMYQVYVLVFLLGAARAFFRPALSACIPSLIPVNQLNKANSLLRFGSSITEIAGPVAGGTVILLLGAPASFLANGVSFLIASAMEIWVAIPRVSNTSSSKPVLQDLADGWRCVRKNATLAKVFSVMAMLVFFAQPMAIVLKTLTDGYYHAGSLGLGLLVAASATGTLVATIYLIAKPDLPGWPGLFLGFPVVSGIAIILIGWIHSFPVALALMFVEGLVGGLGEIVFATMIQTMSPDEMRGKVFGFFASITAALAPLAYAVAGVALDKASVEVVLTVSGLALVAGGVVLVQGALPTLKAGKTPLTDTDAGRGA
ncbi:MAG: MFS transporter [Firmicutes bacterium]|nr:MFS transporter [Bacillota bacterium]